MHYLVHRIEKNDHLGIADKPQVDKVEATNFSINENGDLSLFVGLPGGQRDACVAAYAYGSWQRVERKEPA